MIHLAYTDEDRTLCGRLRKNRRVFDDPTEPLCRNCERSGIKNGSYWGRVFSFGHWTLRKQAVTTSSASVTTWTYMVCRNVARIIPGDAT